MGWKPWVGAGLCAALAFGYSGLRAEEGKEAKEGNKDGAKRERPQRGGDNNGGGRRGGPGGQGGFGGFGGFGGGPGGFGGRGGLERMLDGALGIESGVKVDQLSYGESRRLVTRVPVGGIDSLNDFADGWKVEDIYTVTDEQSKALTGLRDEYKTELEKLQKQLDEANAAIATQVKALREKYELRANDVLTGEAKGEKEKLDALAKEYTGKHKEQSDAKKTEAEDLVKEGQKAMTEAREQNNWNLIQESMRKGGEFMRAVREKADEINKEYAEKMKAIPTGDAKTKLEAELQKLEKRGQRGGPGGPGGNQDRGGQGNGGGNGGGGQPQKPDAPPDNF
ncbi:MAG: hypothetical protein KIS92_01800 [Planctomycetota bacterium]|nr:hypothetical protein [Planctomycetota bacterium]